MALCKTVEVGEKKKTWKGHSDVESVIVEASCKARRKISQRDVPARMGKIQAIEQTQGYRGGRGLGSAKTLPH